MEDGSSYIAPGQHWWSKPMMKSTPTIFPLSGNQNHINMSILKTVECVWYKGDLIAMFTMSSDHVDALSLIRTECLESNGIIWRSWPT